MFAPSPYSFSRRNPEEPAPETEPADTAASPKPDMFASIAQGIGLLGSGIISTVGASSLQKAQQKHEKTMAKKQATLAVLQTSASSAQASAARAAAALAGQGTKKTIYVVGGLLIAITVIAGTVVVLKRKPPAEEE